LRLIASIRSVSAQRGSAALEDLEGVFLVGQPERLGLLEANSAMSREAGFQAFWCALFQLK